MKKMFKTEELFGVCTIVLLIPSQRIDEISDEIVGIPNKRLAKDEIFRKFPELRQPAKEFNQWWELCRSEYNGQDSNEVMESRLKKIRLLMSEHKLKECYDMDV